MVGLSPIRSVHHPNLFMVRLRPPAQLADSLWTGRLSGRAATALGYLERAGRVRSVTRLDGDEDVEASFRAGLQGATPQVFEAGVPDDPLANLTMIEIDPLQPLEPLLIELANDPLVLRVSRVPTRHLIDGPEAGDAADAVRSWWNLVKIRWNEARRAESFIEANDIVVAVLDTGIDPGHPDLRERVEGYWRRWGVSDQDIVGHGTHVAGIIAAQIGDGGIDGICACKLRPFKVFDDEPSYYEEAGRFEYLVNPKSYLRALRQCMIDPVNVINLSLAGYERDPEEEHVIGELIRANRVVVAGMGNDGRGANRRAFPAALDGVVAVGATNADDRCIRSSSSGAHIALCAPGDAIWSTLPTYPGQHHYEAVFDDRMMPLPGAPMSRARDYHFGTGTSMAAAHVSGAVALLLARNPRLSPGEVRRRLMDTAEKLGEMSTAAFTPAHGAGRLSLEALLAGP